MKNWLLFLPLLDFVPWKVTCHSALRPVKCWHELTLGVHEAPGTVALSCAPARREEWGHGWRDT